MLFSLPVALSLLQALSAVNAAYTPRSIHARHAALLRARAPAPPLPAPLIQPVIKKRDSKKCRPRPSSSSISPSSTPVAPVDPASDPNTPSTSSQVTTQTPTSTFSNPPQSHTTQKAPPPPPTTTKSSPPPTHSSSGGGNSGSSGGGGGGGSDPFGSFYEGVQTGQLTFYELGLTACGQTFTDADMVCAVSHSLFDAVPGAGANPNNNPVCGKQVRVTYQGNSIVVSVVDRCTACKPTDLDLSPSAFSQLASQSLGRLSDATWEWI